MIEQIKLSLSADAETRLCTFLQKKVRGIRDGLRSLHEDKLMMWRRTYEAIPMETIREFPWHGASNLVVPVVAIHSDTLLARVMAAIFKTNPLWVARLVGKFGKEALDWQTAFEQYMQYVGIEPSELDLYRVYHEWFGEAIRYGTSVLKTPWVRILEDKVSGTTAGDGTGKPQFTTHTKYEGPRPEKIPFNDFGMMPTWKTIEAADFKYHRIRYSRFQLQMRAYQGIYDKTKVNEILGKPDAVTPDMVMQTQMFDAGATVTVQDGYEEYWVYECHFTHRTSSNRYVNVIAWYNEKNNTILRAYYFYYPEDIFIAARLFYRDDYFFGYGFCETLGMFQEEISQQHNQRRDNMTVSNTMMWRVRPDSLYNKGYRLVPGGMLPGEEGDIEAMQTGQVSPMTIDEERLSLELAEKRSGVSGPMHGSGSGVMSKRGVYSSMGTLALLQEGNTRTDLNITDIRYAHTKLGRLLSNQYAEFGIGDRASRFGLDGALIHTAFDGIKSKRLNLPVYASTASVNREVEKQSDLMLGGMMQKHYMMISQMLQGANNQFADPAQKKYLMDAIDAANTLMRMTMKHFNYDEVDRFVPDVETQATQKPPQGQPNAAGQGAQPAGAPAISGGGSEGAPAALPQGVIPSQFSGVGGGNVQ